MKLVDVLSEEYKMQEDIAEACNRFGFADYLPGFPCDNDFIDLCQTRKEAFASER
jgi:hypothetical protein